ncbi:MAG TPA: hypothetical protein VFC44_15320, partial [Candidatus Saccharimonadales bacterium]|nr:hypothetical protein [Candidatus Saccharimonadales bacterium]
MISFVGCWFRWFGAWLLGAVLLTGCRQGGNFAAHDPRLKIVSIASDRRESFLAMACDGMGRLFVGGREGLF